MQLWQEIPIHYLNSCCIDYHIWVNMPYLRSIGGQYLSSIITRILASVITSHVDTNGGWD